LVRKNRNGLDMDCPNCGNDTDTYRNSCDELRCDNCGYSEGQTDFQKKIGIFYHEDTLLTFIKIIIILGIGAFIGLSVTNYANYLNEEDEKLTIVCEELNPTEPRFEFVDYDYTGAEEKCIYKNYADYREVGYTEISYYLIDKNHLGRIV